jgi:hypothetical protein
MHEDPRLGIADPVLRENNIIGDIDGRVNDATLSIEKENKIPSDSGLRNFVGSYVVDGVLMGYNPLISNEEQIFKRCARF